MLHNYVYCKLSKTNFFNKQCIIYERYMGSIKNFNEAEVYIVCELVERIGV